MAAETESVDVLARVLAVLGGLVGVASLLLQYVRHRTERPKLSVVVKTYGDDSSDISVQVRNARRTPGGVTDWELKHLDDDTVSTIANLGPQPLPIPGTVPGFDSVGFDMTVHAWRDGAPTAHFRVCVTRYNGKDMFSEPFAVPAKPLSEAFNTDELGKPVW